jgi:hypothetical protein
LRKRARIRQKTKRRAKNFLSRNKKVEKIIAFFKFYAIIIGANASGTRFARKNQEKGL